MQHQGAVHGHSIGCGNYSSWECFSVTSVVCAWMKLLTRLVCDWEKSNLSSRAGTHVPSRVYVVKLVQEVGRRLLSCYTRDQPHNLPHVSISKTNNATCGGHRPTENQRTSPQNQSAKPTTSSQTTLPPHCRINMPRCKMYRVNVSSGLAQGCGTSSPCGRLVHASPDALYSVAEPLVSKRGLRAGHTSFAAQQLCDSQACCAQPVSTSAISVP